MWNDNEKENVVHDWELFNNGKLSYEALRAAYQDRTINAIREKAFELQTKPMPVTSNGKGKSPFVESIRLKMEAAGIANDLIQRVLAPNRLFSLTPKQINKLNDAIRVKGNVNVTFETSSNGINMFFNTPVNKILAEVSSALPE